jgi:dihydroneopterin aldolase
MPLDVIRIAGLSTKSVIGVYPSERRQGQAILLDVALHLDTRGAASSGKITRTVDYGRLAGELRFLLHACRFTLLETAAEALCRYLLLPSRERDRPKIHAACVTLTKPNAPGGVTPSLTIERQASEYEYVVETKDFGHVDIVHESPAYGIYRLRIEPGRSIDSHRHATMEEHELVLGSGLHLQKKPVSAGMAFAWPHGLVHRYDNPSEHEVGVLCVDCPRFIPQDEIPTSEPSEGFTEVPGTLFYPAEHQSPYAGAP